MKIIIIGAGQVGSTLAENLAREYHDITLIDLDETRLQFIQDHHDIRTVTGTGCHPDILLAAGIEDADMLVSVTNSDEINIVACQVAHSIFDTPKKIARIRARNYFNKDYKDLLFSDSNMPVDVLIAPEQAVTDYVRKLVEQPGALQVLDFADGVIRMIGMRATKNSPLVDQKLKTLKEHVPKADARVAAIYRRNKAIVPSGETIIEDGDEVFFIAAKKNIKKVMSELRKAERPYKRIIIAGGGNIGYRLAVALESSLNIKIIEVNLERATFLSEQLNHTVVLSGSASDQELLLDENIDKTDVFIALTNDDEVNIMASLLAKRLGAKKVMTLITNPVYANLMQGGEIDVAISPQLATTSSVLAHVRKGDTGVVHSLRRGAAEALEFIVHGDVNNSKVVGKEIGNLVMPVGTTVAALVRDSEVIIAHHDVIIKNNDHVIVVVINKNKTKAVEKLFAAEPNLF
ncbi:MAG: Trk system potassium transporter TrkA [SAR92 clade bacterium]|jgi:trk system potassium uptake protein TrkA|uniref:Trk system potassium uptake protein TrkA n=1 Tax=SAR92 clade bacterium TaxID=2315479 RepID=A0A520LMY1_9GAMM|nr:Trk system potassium transporter TrkA [Gammaproteobacteria bacterium]MDC3105700.1 Trk system potassium transporter TrkA [Gammaproteobacteria bacterium]RZO07607.1 MAG: Trk system potassium transporter TrkA [SAR92 clade bacterium]|tara:strand:+ start:2911 stop:4293 length:1383 start_codon:yes stop_codon:yes gene_type:complete